MKKLLLATLLTLSAGAMAQTANNSATSSTTTSAQGNNQNVIFTSPPTSTSNSNLTSQQNIVNSGATQQGVDYSGSYTIKNVPSVSGPNLTTSNDTCMGSSSASANGPGIGLSFGTTWTDEHCKRLKMSRELWNKGMKAASLAMDCMDPQAAAALEMTGSKCPQSMTAEERVSAFGPQASAAGASVATQRPVATQPVSVAAPVATPVAMSAPVAAPVAVPAPVPAASLVFPVDTPPPTSKTPVPGPQAAAPVVPEPAVMVASVAVAATPVAEPAPGATVVTPIVLSAVFPMTDATSSPQASAAGTRQ